MENKTVVNIETVIEYIEKHLDGKLELEMVAEAVHYSKYHLHRMFTLYLVLMALYGVALTTVQTALTTILQEKTETSMQGRVFGLMSSLYSGCYPIGMAYSNKHLKTNQ